MILANHPCPNCKAILECEGVTEGELVDCPQCGKPFEVPFSKKTFQKTLSVSIQKDPPPIPDDPKEKACPFCGETIQFKAIKCRHCNEVLKKKEYSQVVYDQIDLEKSPYYVKVFSEISKKGTRFEARWNWAAFLFGAFWYLSKGMWAKSIIMIGGSLLLGGIPFIFVWFYCGMLGNWDYYMYKVEGKQLW